MDSLEADYIKKMRKHDAELANGWGQIATPPLVGNIWTFPRKDGNS